MSDIQPLLKKLESAKFTGTLHLRFEAGNVAAVELVHLLAFSELNKPLPIIDAELFELKP